MVVGGGRSGIDGGFYSKDLLHDRDFSLVQGTSNKFSKKLFDSLEHPQTPSRGVRAFEQKLPVSLFPYPLPPTTEA